LSASLAQAAKFANLAEQPLMQRKKMVSRATQAWCNFVQRRRGRLCDLKLLNSLRAARSVFIQPCLSDVLSLPKIRSDWIRSMSQNHCIIRADVCDPARAVDLRCRHFQVATQAGSREPVSSSSA
jgi:hypothetical protein